MHTSVRATSGASVRLAASHLADRSADGAGGDPSPAAIAASDRRALVVEIVERASTLRERLRSAPPTESSDGSAHDNVLLAAWRAAAAKGDADLFALRLARDGLDGRAVERAAVPVRMAPGAPLPEWALLLERYIAALEDAPTEAAAGDERFPFVEILAPLVDVAERELYTASKGALDGVSGGALDGLRAALLQRLADLAAPILYERFERYRADAEARRLRELGDGFPIPVASRALYRDFVRWMTAQGMLRLFHDLPALARAMATVALLWRDACAELLAHLHADRDAIARHFASGRAPGELVTIDAGRSDPHAGGRTVHMIGFASGLRLVYKPRALGVDRAFLELLHWLALRGAPVPPPLAPTFAARVLERGGHGWAEYVEQRECPDKVSVRRYYQNAGSLLALLHVLGSTDCHYENIVASGDQPVVVDLETVLQPEIARADPPRDRARNLGARRLYDDSVLRTGMLPAWQDAGGDGAYDTGGLSADDDQATPFAALRWSAVNSDAMRLDRRRATTGSHPNLPRLAGRAMTPERHVSDVVLGFTRMYEWLAAHRDELLEPGGPLARLAREEVRFLARPSSVYDHVLRRSLRRAVLHDGASRGVELELLARGLLKLSPELWPLLEEEERALEQLDIPVFTIRGDATRLALGDRSVSVARSGLQVARARLESLGPAELERQLRIVRSSFALRYFAKPASGYPRAGPAACLPVTPLPREEIIAAAMELASEIGRTALSDRAGDVTWITTEPVSTTGHQRLQATGYGIYDGLAGIALFLAAASRCGGDAETACLARRALAPIRSRLHASSSFVDELGIGGAGGVASLIYALTRAGLLLGDDSILDDALHAARQITTEAITLDRDFDVLNGSAGAILALLALYRVRRCDWILEMAVRCGRHLLDTRKEFLMPYGTLHRAWPTVGGKAHVGFAHGCAGIALALLRLHAATLISEYATAAMDALRWEDSFLHQGSRAAESDAGVARNIASHGATMPLPTNWCRGSAGIGLARIAAPAGAHCVELRNAARHAVAHVRADAELVGAPSDGACCGVTGEVDLLLTAGLRWGESALLASAHERASSMVRHARAVGGYRLTPSGGTDVYDPALYRGTAGIGYGLLRLCHPELLPSFLSWE
ncbi:MAG TPA: type 2 lanthipeptide synthetase LanM [Gemmatimonadaceae bacterium]|nr:type 2 lanthipeptide synthetase LanM [Gemmatimonadaceae bacterium]